MSAAPSASDVSSPSGSPAAAIPRGRILVTGGAGFIGSHTCVELVHAGFAVTILDNYSNSTLEAVRRIRALVPHPDWVELVEACLVKDAQVLDKLISGHPYGAVIHFAALKVRRCGWSGRYRGKRVGC
jgi:UDP-glucose 4-epimerase